MNRLFGSQPADHNKQPVALLYFVRTLCSLLVLAGTAQAFEPIHELPEALLPDSPAGLRGVLSNRGEDVHKMIEDVGRQDGIEHVRILNKQGVIIYSSDPGEINNIVDRKAEGCN